MFKTKALTKCTICPRRLYYDPLTCPFCFQAMLRYKHFSGLALMQTIWSQNLQYPIYPIDIDQYPIILMICSGLALMQTIWSPARSWRLLAPLPLPSSSTRRLNRPRLLLRFGRTDDHSRYFSCQYSIDCCTQIDNTNAQKVMAQIV